MDKKGSVLMISLWIMAILVIFAIALGHRASINLKLAGYQKDRLKAYYLAQSGVRKAISELLNDKTPNYDSPQDNWADNEGKFKKITLDENDNAFATVFGLVDEDRKININITRPEDIKILEELFIFKGLEDEVKDGLAQAVVDYIAFKTGKLKTPEELILVLEYFYKNKRGDKDYKYEAWQAYAKVKDLITVYADTGINVNTASQDVFTILVNSITDENTKDHASELIRDIIVLRQDKKYFTSLDEINFDGKPSEYDTLLDALKGKITVQSQYFRIEATGYAGKTIKHIITVYNRDKDEKRFVYWHEN